MPIVLTPGTKGWNEWLDVDKKTKLTTSEIESILKQYTTPDLNWYEVSQDVNKVSHNGPNLIQPLEKREKVEEENKQIVKEELEANGKNGGQANIETMVSKGQKNNDKVKKEKDAEDNDNDNDNNDKVKKEDRGNNIKNENENSTGKPEEKLAQDDDTGEVKQDKDEDGLPEDFEEDFEEDSDEEEGKGDDDYEDEDEDEEEDEEEEDYDEGDEIEGGEEEVNVSRTAEKRKEDSPPAVHTRHHDKKQKV